MFRKFLLPLLLCGVLMLGGCGLPGQAQPENNSSTSQAQEDENIVASNAKPKEWTRTSAPGLGFQYEYPSNWIFKNLAYGTNDSWGSTFVEYAIDGLDCVSMYVLEPIPLKCLSEAELTEYIKGYFAYTTLTQFDEHGQALKDEEGHYITKIAPWYETTFSGYERKQIGENDVIRLSFHLENLTGEFHENPRTPYTTFWIVMTPEDRNYLFLCGENDNTRTYIADMERLIQSMTPLETYYYSYYTAEDREFYYYTHEYDDPVKDFHWEQVSYK